MAPINGDDGISGIPVPPPGTYGVWGDAKSTYGVAGTSGGPAGVRGESNMPPEGEFGEGGHGVEGISTADAGVGVYGDGPRGTGIRGKGRYGVHGSGFLAGVLGAGGNIGVVGNGKTGISGFATESGLEDTGVVGRSINGYGVRGYGGNIGVYAENTNVHTAAYLATPGLAGDFRGDVFVWGTLWQTGIRFLIDHPLDPAHRYLSHASVESAEQKNLYDGIATLDGQGEAVVELPDWFSALNGQLRYQLTCLGQYAPVFVAKKLEANRFRIAGGIPGLEVSWQVTGIRQDAWAKANPLTTEQEKPQQERGTYLHPELFGQPQEKSQQRALYPEAAFELPEEMGERQRKS